MEHEQQPGSPGTTSLRIDEIKGNRHQPRQVFDLEKLEELARSIRSKGLLQPIMVRRSDEGYELVAGERRLRAAAQAGLERVPVVIREMNDGEAAEISLIENIQREDLNPIEKALAFKRLME